MAMPAPLVRDSDQVYAVPSFRILLQVEKPMGDPAMKALTASLLDLFLDGLNLEGMYFGRAGGRYRRLSATPVTDKVIARARAWAAEAEWEWPSTLRFTRWFEEFDLGGPPSLRLEQRARLSTIQIELPPDSPLTTRFADRVLELVAELPVVWGVMGFGMFQPVALDSLIWMLPRATSRYRCAIEVQPNAIDSELRRTATVTELRLKIEPVVSIPDIGWRTLIGDEFLPRLPDLDRLSGRAGITLSRGDGFTVIEAGPAPIWGDAALGEDIAPYRAVAGVLQPCRTSLPRACDALFGGSVNDNGEARIRQWYERFDESG